MAQARFAGTTFWDDGDTGRGTVAVSYTPQQMLRVRRRLAGGSDYVSSIVGTEPASVDLRLSYFLDDGDVSDLGTLLHTLSERQGTLQVPGLQDTFSNCQIDGDSPPIIMRGEFREECGVGGYEVTLNVRFKKLRSV